MPLRPFEHPARLALLVLLTLGTGLASCRKPLVLNGTARIRDGSAPPAGATLEVQLADVTHPERAPVIIARTLVAPLGPAPWVFGLSPDTSALDPARTYAVQARVTLGGAVRYLNRRRVTVEARHAADTVRVSLDTVAQRLGDASEEPELPAGIADIVSRRGLYEQVSGSSIASDPNLAWTTFYERGVLRMAEEHVDRGAAGNTQGLYVWDAGRLWFARSRSQFRMGRRADDPPHDRFLMVTWSVGGNPEVVYQVDGRAQTPREEMLASIEARARDIVVASRLRQGH